MLKAKHLFPFLKLIKAMGAKDLLQRLARLWKEAKEKAGGTDTEAAQVVMEEIGLDVVAMLLEKVPDAENEFFGFLSVYTGKKREELDELSFEELVEILKGIVQEANFSSFFQSAVASAEK
jgi:hypothetical protein